MILTLINKINSLVEVNPNLSQKLNFESLKKYDGFDIFSALFMPENFLFLQIKIAISAILNEKYCNHFIMAEKIIF